MKIIEAKGGFPVQSHRDLALWGPILSDTLRGARIDRVFVPEYPLHPARFLKRTLVLELANRTEAFQLLISLRPQECGVVLFRSKTFKPNPIAPKSGFELGLMKHLPGTMLTGVSNIQGDRVLVLDFRGQAPLSLHLHLIPARPAGVLLLAGALLQMQSTDQREEYTPPSPRETSIDSARIPFHPEWFRDPFSYGALWREAETRAHLQLRLQAALRQIHHELKSIGSKIKSLEEQIRITGEEQDWSRLGALLQSVFHENPTPKDGHYELFDPETNRTLRAPARPGLTAARQADHFFHLAKRKKRRLTDSRERVESLQKKQEELVSVRTALESAETIEDLTRAEAVLGISSEKSSESPKEKARGIAGFTGRKYLSKEGLTILTGRNQAENLELTFKIARGNDLWLHLRGRPGAHTVILLPPKRTASLETLLDAAHLCILHSGRRGAGKTEVDYTYRKYVKRIKNQTEVSYTSNKTLVVVPDEERMKRITESTG